MTQRRVVLVAAPFLLGVAALLVWTSEGTQPKEPPPPAVEHPARWESQRPPLPVTHTPDTPADERPRSAWRAGHAAVAKELGYVAIECWVGPEWDSGDLVGPYRQMIHDGWYSHVETALSGRHGVERRYRAADTDEHTPVYEQFDWETLFIVSWQASEPGSIVPCEVQFLEHGDLHVKVFDQRGSPVVGATVYGCGSAETDAEGMALLADVIAGEPCDIQAYGSTIDEDYCRGSGSYAPLEPDEVRSVELQVDCLTMEQMLHGDPEAVEALRAEHRAVEAPDAPDLELPLEEEILRLRRLRDRGVSGTESGALITSLLSKKEGLRDHLRRQEERSAERDALMEALERDPSHEAAQEMVNEMKAQLDGLLHDP